MYRCFLDRFIARVKIDEEQMSALQNELQESSSSTRRNVFFVSRRPSFVEASLIKHLCRRYGLPEPQGSFLNLSLEKRFQPMITMMSLRMRSGTELWVSRAYEYRKRLAKKLEAFLQTNRDDSSSKERAIFLPISIFAGRGPDPLLRPLALPLDFSFFPLGDFWLLIAYAFYRNSLRLDMGPPLVSKPHQSCAELLTLCSRALYQQEKKVRGARIQRQKTVREIVLSGKRFESILSDQAIFQHLSRESVLRQSQKIFREIAATMQGPVLCFFRFLLTPLFRKIFQDIEIKGIERLRAVVNQYPVVLLPSHRSHFDYLILTYVLYHEDLPLPYIAAGDNLNFFPVGALLKAAGGFFVRRKIEADPLYKTILENYLTYLIKQGHVIEFYIEGGRTRSGFTRFPRFGLLKYLLHAIEQKSRSDLSFFPVSIIYERVPEEQGLVAELSGNSGKSKESIFHLLRFSRNLFQNFGPVTVHFGTPISIKDFHAKALENLKDPNLRDPGHQDSFLHVARRRPLVEILGTEIAQRIAAGSAIPARALFASAFLASIGPTVSPVELSKNMLTILKVIAVSRGYLEANKWDLSYVLFPESNQPLKQAQENLFRFLPLTQTLFNALSYQTLEEGLLQLIHEFENTSLVSISFVQGQKFLGATQEQRIHLEFYKNHLWHLLILPAFIGLAYADTAFSHKPEDCLETPFSTLDRLYQIFRVIFLFPNQEAWYDRTKEVLDHFQQIQWFSLTASSVEAFNQFSSSQSGVSIQSPAPAHRPSTHLVARFPGSSGTLLYNGLHSLAPICHLILPYFEALYAAVLALKNTSSRETLDNRMRRTKTILENSVEMAFPYLPESTTTSTLSFACQYLMRSEDSQREEQAVFFLEQIHKIRGLVTRTSAGT